MSGLYLFMMIKSVGASIIQHIKNPPTLPHSHSLVDKLDEVGH